MRTATPDAALQNLPSVIQVQEEPDVSSAQDKKKDQSYNAVLGHVDK